MSAESEQEHPGISLIRKYVDETQTDPDAQQPAPQPQAPDAPPQGPQAMDFAGQQGVAPAPEPPAPQPAPQAPPEPEVSAPMQHPQLNRLSAPHIASNYHADLDQANDTYNQGVAQLENSARQTTAINMQNNDITAQALPIMAEMDRQYQGVRNGIDEHLMNVTQQSVADMDVMRNQQEQLLNENPHNWWGNASTVNKIGAVIGMIGAGLHGDNATEYLQKLVDNSVAENMRKQHALQRLGYMNRERTNTEEDIARNQYAQLDARKAAGYSYIENQVKQRLAMSKNPQEIANLTKTLGEIKIKKAEHEEKGAHEIQSHDLNALKTQLEVEKQQFDQGQTALKASEEKQPKDPNTYLTLNAFKGRGIQQPVYKEAADKISASESVVASIDKARKLLSSPSVESAYGLKQVNAQILSELRKLQGTGANLSPEEVKNIEALTPAWGDVVRGSLSLVDFNKRLTAAQRLVSDSALTYARNVGAPENELSESSPLYNVRKGEQDEDAQGQKEIDDKQRASDILKKYARQ